MVEKDEIGAKVRSAVESLFPPEERDAAICLLPRTAELPLNPDVERVHLAIVTLSEGDLAKLGGFADNARRDWRDVLYWAEYTKPGRALYEPLMDQVAQRLSGDEH